MVDVVLKAVADLDLSDPLSGRHIRALIHDGPNTYELRASFPDSLEFRQTLKDAVYSAIREAFRLGKEAR